MVCWNDLQAQSNHIKKSRAPGPVIPNFRHMDNKKHTLTSNLIAIRNLHYITSRFMTNFYSLLLAHFEHMSTIACFHFYTLAKTSQHQQSTSRSYFWDYG